MAGKRSNSGVKHMGEQVQESSSEQAAFARNLQQALLGAELAPEHYVTFTRLSKTLIHGATFQFVLAELYSEPLRDRLIAILDKMLAVAGIKSTVLVLDRTSPASVAELEARLFALSQEFAVVHLCGVDAWLDPALHPDRWRDLNIRRDAVAQTCRARFVWWLSPEQVCRCAEQAPDLWSWRSGLYPFPENPTPQPIQAQFAPHFDTRSLPEKGRRLSQLSTWLAQNPPDEIRVQLLDEQANIWQQLGEWDQAETALQEKLVLCSDLGNNREVAITHGKIADIWQAWGQLDDALRIRQEIQLPVYEQLGDIRAAAIAHGKIADIWQARGQWDDALCIRQEIQLPVYEQLGDIRAAAITHGRIADIWEARGQLDDALRIRQERELPVYEQLGDIRAAAITHGKIANIWQARGQLDEALRIRQEQELPVYEQLGDVRELFVAKAKMGHTLLQRNKGNDLIEAKRLLNEALAMAKGLQLPQEIAQIQAWREELAALDKR